jgi:S1-C subfamily serine protease
VVTRRRAIRTLASAVVVWSAVFMLIVVGGHEEMTPAQPASGTGPIGTPPPTTTRPPTKTTPPSSPSPPRTSTSLSSDPPPMTSPSRSTPDSATPPAATATPFRVATVLPVRAPLAISPSLAPALAPATTSNALSGSLAPGAPADTATVALAVAPALVDIDASVPGGPTQAGSGMVLTATGEVLTNDHVVSGADQLSVRDVGNAQTYTATVTGTDPSDDIAVLQLAGASGLQTINAASPFTVVVGESIVAIGNAKGVGGTPSYAGGSVTALGQNVTATDPIDGRTETLSDVIATNAQLIPGDSGGPLVDSTGRVLGMDTATSTAGGYAIPLQEVLAVATQLIGN